ncbi:MAG: hypothetical protein JWQ04_1160 [Pedosphaera sp.]|nr:hypothetical protein [Pedosphaera sp.]
MKAPVHVSLLAVSLLLGCGDKNAGNTASAPNAPGSSPMNAPADYVGALGNGQNRAIKAVDIASLNQAIQIFNVNEGRFPKDLNELVDAKLINRIPDAPRGMKLFYDAGSGTVKVVNQ